ncbi:HIT domain-containing protein [Methylocaldum gracile subsp. desertum]|nr:diadenosine tetraphosphate (Ap4A) HIT family hydrolase [Methylocaldum sp. RMAD-M]
MNENRYPWFILVPEREELSEIYQLTDEDQVQLMRESSHLSRTLSELFRADKMNIAAIGNLVPQLHLHHVVRYRGDPAWPGPIWGRFDPLPYDAPTIMEIRRKLGAAPLQHFVFFD